MGWTAVAIVQSACNNEMRIYEINIVKRREEKRQKTAVTTNQKNGSYDIHVHRKLVVINFFFGMLVCVYACTHPFCMAFITFIETRK